MTSISFPISHPIRNYIFKPTNLFNFMECDPILSFILLTLSRMCLCVSGMLWLVGGGWRSISCRPHQGCVSGMLWLVGRGWRSISCRLHQECVSGMLWLVGGGWRSISCRPHQECVSGMLWLVGGVGGLFPADLIKNVCQGCCGWWERGGGLFPADLPNHTPTTATSTYHLSHAELLFLITHANTCQQIWRAFLLKQAKHFYSDLCKDIHNHIAGTLRDCWRKYSPHWTKHHVSVYQITLLQINRVYRCEVVVLKMKIPCKQSLFI